MTVHDLLVRHEGLRLKPYTDTTGHVTIGVGRNLTDVGISEHEAMDMLQNDLIEVESQLVEHFPRYADLSPVRQAVLQDMCFNLGISALLGFHATLSNIWAGDYSLASHYMLQSQWARQVPGRAQELATMLRTDTFPDGSR